MTPRLTTSPKEPPLRTPRALPFALLADLISQVPGSHIVLPLNVVMSLFGVPVIVWVILRQRKVSFAA